MYGQSHQQGHNVYMNGSHGHPRYGMQMNNSKPFQSSSQHSGPNHRGQHDHANPHGNFVSHQHNASTPAFGNATPHFATTQLRNGTPSHLANGVGRSTSEHWAKQMEAAQQAREAINPHHHARHANLNKGASIGSIEVVKKDVEREKEERHRATANADDSQQQWNELDMGGQGLRAIAAQLFQYPFLTALHLNANKLTFIPPEIGKLRKLRHLDLSCNNLRILPPELGMLVNLKELHLFNNELVELPMELGYLYQLEMLGIDGNPIDEGIKSMMMEHGTKNLIAELRENIEVPDVNDRETCIISEVKSKGSATSADTMSVMSYNILCDKMATRSQYGYAPEAALAWDKRRSLILEELRARDPDVMCLQEIDTESFSEFFSPQLAHEEYKGVFWPKNRARTMREDEAKAVDGCAIFFKKKKFVLLDKQMIDLPGIAIKRPDMKGEHDIFNRYMPRDNIGVVAFFEERQSGARVIMATTHLHWDPTFDDVKIIQTAVMMEEITRLADAWSKHPPCKDKQLFPYSKADEDPTSADEPINMAPSQEYSNGAAIPLIVCGDFNSIPGSGVHELLNTGSLAPDHPQLQDFHYGNFTREGMAHPFQLKSAYGSIGELQFTNYTPGFAEVIDYVWYSTNAFQVLELLGDVDRNYLTRVPGFPNAHFPSDHLALQAKFAIKPKKDRQKPVDGESV